MPFCANCGNEVSEDVSFCTDCGNRLKIGSKSETQSRKRSKVVRFVIGLIAVGVICGVLFLIEDLTIPYELKVQIELARMQGHPLPYDPWAPEASVGLLSAYAFAGLIYFVFAPLNHKQVRNNPLSFRHLLKDS